MFKQLCTTVALTAAFSLASAWSLPANAQDRPDEHRDDQRPAEHKPAPRPDEHRDDKRPDPADRYRHDHPHSSARCHDGFFTNTADRSRACSKHGGINVWLAL